MSLDRDNDGFLTAADLLQAPAFGPAAMTESSACARGDGTKCFQKRVPNARSAPHHYVFCRGCLSVSENTPSGSAALRVLQMVSE